MSQWDASMAAWLQKAVLVVNPEALKVKQAKLSKWADTFRLLREKDRRHPNTIKRVLTWVFTGEGEQREWWRARVQSPESLRSNWDAIWARMVEEVKSGFG